MKPETKSCWECIVSSVTSNAETASYETLTQPQGWSFDLTLSASLETYLNTRSSESITADQ